MKLTTIAAADAGGRDPDGKPITLPVAAPEVLKTVFDTGDNQTSRVIPVETGAVFVVHTDKVVPPAEKALADVKAQVTAAWQAQQKLAAVKKQAADLAAAVTPGAELAKIATDKGLTATTTAPLSRRPDEASRVPPVLVAKLFAAKEGEVIAADDPNAAYVAQVKEIQSPTSTPDAEAAKLSLELGNAERIDLVNEFTEGLRQRFPVQVDHAAINKIF
jgi:peptidyl-prolyl cis-trans isomerase D